jgi:hypothetical protein
MFNNFIKPRRVVITGFGCVTPIGIGRENFWESLQNGVSGVRQIESFDVSDSKVKIAAEVKNFDWEAELTPKDRKHVPRTVPLALAAAREAMKDAQIETKNFSLSEKQNFGVVLGTGGGGLAFTEKQYKYWFAPRPTAFAVKNDFKISADNFIITHKRFYLFGAPLHGARVGVQKPKNVAARVFRSFVKLFSAICFGKFYYFKFFYLLVFFGNLNCFVRASAINDNNFIDVYQTRQHIESFADCKFFVEGWNDNGNFHKKLNYISRDFICFCKSNLSINARTKTVTKSF